MSMEHPQGDSDTSVCVCVRKQRHLKSDLGLILQEFRFFRKKHHCFK